MVIPKELFIKLAITLAVTLAVWLPIAFSVHREGKRFADKFEGLNYELRQPKFVFWLGVISAALFIAPVIIVPFTGNETFTPLVAIGFFAFAMLGTFLAVYALQWRITVQNNRLIVRMPFKREREMYIGDITTVKQKYNGIIAYINDKRVFAVDIFVIGFELFCAQLYEAGILESTQKQDSFVVRQNKGCIVISILGILFFCGCLIWTIFWPNETVDNFVYIVFGGLTIFSLYLLIYPIRWRLIIADDTLSVRNIIGKEKIYSIKSITRVNIKKDGIVICIGKRKIVKVEVGCDNFPILSERLHSEGITFIYRGKPVE